MDHGDSANERIGPPGPPASLVDGTGPENDEGNLVARTGEHHVAVLFVDRQAPADPVAHALESVFGALQDQPSVDGFAALYLGRDVISARPGPGDLLGPSGLSPRATARLP